MHTELEKALLFSGNNHTELENAEFYVPKYPTEKSRKIINSDKRTTIHWELNIHLNKKGEAGLSFYTADGKACRYVKQIR